MSEFDPLHPAPEPDESGLHLTLGPEETAPTEPPSLGVPAPPPPSTTSAPASPAPSRVEAAPLDLRLTNPGIRLAQVKEEVVAWVKTLDSAAV